MPDAFRCSAASRADREPLAGSAPTEAAWFLVEYVGSWGHSAVADSRLPEAVKAHLADRTERVQLIRRHGRDTADHAVRLFRADVATGVLETATISDHTALLDGEPAWASYEGRLWLVCTNGRRDVCCAEQGRPIAAALTTRWPDETWETSHLGGHRFAGTLVALPSGWCLGHLDAGAAVEACALLEAGEVPLDLARGQVGRPGTEQVRELFVRRHPGVDPATLRVESRLGPPRRQSCADLRTKPAPVYTVTVDG